MLVMADQCRKLIPFSIWEVVYWSRAPHLLQLPMNLPQILVYPIFATHFVGWTIAGIEPKTLRLVGERFTNWANRPQNDNSNIIDNWKILEKKKRIKKTMEYKKIITGTDKHKIIPFQIPIWLVWWSVLTHKPQPLDLKTCSLQGFPFQSVPSQNLYHHR